MYQTRYYPYNESCKPIYEESWKAALKGGKMDYEVLKRFLEDFS